MSEILNRLLAPEPARRRDANVEAAQGVMDQLAEDFPASAIQWVSGAHWRGPVKVPIGNIDMSGRDTWNATKDSPKDKQTWQDRVKEQGEDTKPIVLVKAPGNPKFTVVDGHHRLLAYEALGKSPRAWVGRVGSNGGPWNETHSLQLRGPSRTGPTSRP